MESQDYYKTRKPAYTGVESVTPVEAPVTTPIKEKMSGLKKLVIVGAITAGLITAGAGVKIMNKIADSYPSTSIPTCDFGFSR